MRVYRSVARIKAIEPSHVDEYYWSGERRDITVFEAEGSRNTGLLDSLGNPIISVEAIAPIGFNR